MADNMLKKMKTMVEEAPEAGSFAAINIGKVTATPFVVSWTTDEKGVRMPNKVELTEDHELQPGEYFEFLFQVDVKEFNPALEWTYERNIPVRKSKHPTAEDPKEVLTDWSEIVEPSLVATFGEDYLDALLKSPYVEVEDFPNIAGRTGKPKDGKKPKVFGVPKFLRVFKTRAEAEAAHKERFGSKDGAASNGAKITPEIITKVKGLLKSLKGDKKKVMGLLTTTKPYSDFDAEELIALAEVS